MIALAFAAALAAAPVPPGEEPVDAYEEKASNVGAAPFEGQRMWSAFHGEAGLNRLVEDFVDRLIADPRIADIFKGQDIVRLRRTLREQFCYILNGGCAYSGRDMKTTHKDLGIQTADMAALVEALQRAMDKERIPFAAQNRFLAKLAPMKRDITER